MRRVGDVLGVSAMHGMDLERVVGEDHGKGVAHAVDPVIGQSVFHKADILFVTAKRNNHI